MPGPIQPGTTQVSMVATGAAARRRVLAAFAAAGTLLLPLRLRASVAATPAMTEGPFYPERFTAQPDARLLRGPIDGAVPLRLTGRVFDAQGAPVAGARVEIWQCDAGGRYHHSRDSREHERDANFAGFGWTLTDASGAYAFETIRPVPYPGRTPHIHVAVVTGGRRRLVTQIFVEGEPGNASDVLYRWLPAQARALLTMRVSPAAQGLQGSFDLRLG